jgi:putative MATE family efflux protein
MTVLGWVGSGSVFSAMHTSEQVTQLGTRFLHVQLAGAVLIYGYFVIDAAFRASGDTRTPFVLLGCCVLLNMAVDPLLITGWGPFPRMGIQGAALAGLLTRGLGLTIGLWLLVRRRGIRPVFGWPVARSVVRIGLPTMMTGVLFSSIYIFLVSIVAAYGTPALAALGIGHKVEGVSYMMSVGFSVAAGTMVGQNLGAGQPARAREAGWTTLRIALVPTFAVSLCLVLFPGWLASLFTTDPAVIAAASGYIAAVGIVQAALTFEVILEAACSGAGYTFWPMVWIVGLSSLRIPLAYWASSHWGLTGIWWILAATMLSRGVALGILWRWGAWEQAKA